MRNRAVKCNRFDNSGEYCRPFDVYCKQHGIKYEKTPQLNDLAERMNKTLIERVRNMLFEARLPKHSWGEALYTVVHVINLSLIVVLNTEVPNKIWFDKDVKYDHLQVFSCKTFVHVPNDEKSKLDLKTRQCIFVGLYDPVEKKLVRSRDVQFTEDQTIEDIDKVKKTRPEKDNSLFEIDLVRMPVHDLDIVENNVHNGEQHDYVDDQQLEDIFYVPLDDNFIILLLYVDDMLIVGKEFYMENAKVVSTPFATHFKLSSGHSLSNDVEKTNMSRIPYTSVVGSLMYVMVQAYWIRDWIRHVRYHWIHDALDSKLLELAKVHIDDSNGDMMTKMLPRGKFEACCEIVGLTITST
ncbi:hypothetical protein CR513_04621, partial [Mucuna pruriens]